LLPAALLLTLAIDGAVTHFMGKSTEPADMLARRFVSLPLSILGLLGVASSLGIRPGRDLGLTSASLGRAWRAGLAIGLFATPLMLGINVVVRSLFPPATSHPALLHLEEGTWSAVASVWLMAGVLAPMHEEILFRGILLLGLQPLAGSQPALLTSSLLFGLAHWGVWPDPIPLTLLGWILAVAFVRTGTLWTPILAHASLNTSMVAMSLWGGKIG
jgi:membrane protease YdiL (CAAX protease family)